MTTDLSQVTSGHGGSSRRRQTALAFVQAYNNWSMDEIFGLRSDDCIFEILPKSMGIPPMTNDEYREFFTPITPGFRNFHIAVHDISEDAANNRLTMLGSSTADTPIGPYANEYAFVFTFNPSGDKIVHLAEFLDSAVFVPFLAKLKEHLSSH